MTTLDTPAVQAHWKQQKPRPVYWYDPATGELFVPSGGVAIIRSLIAGGY